MITRFNPGGARVPRVLIVEDETIVAYDLRQRLERMGLTVVGIESSGEDAIERAIAEGPDLVLMDIRIEGDIDGIETARTMRDRLDVAIVFVTVHSDPETLSRLTADVSFGLIIKPFTDAEISSVIDRALLRRSMEGKELLWKGKRGRYNERPGP